jgi:RHS repeat-associated protein
VRNPDGSTLASATFNSFNSSFFFEPRTLPATGTYTVVMDAALSAVGSMTVQVYDVPADASGTVAIGGPAVTFGNTAPGQNATLTFAGTAGQRIFARFNAGTMTSDSWATTWILKPDGTTLRSDSLCGQACDFDTTTLPATGTYTIVFDPVTVAVGTLTGQLYDVPPDATATTTVGGTPVTVTTTGPGQNAAVTFAGTAGQVVTVAVTASTFGSTSYAVRKPDGTTQSSTTSSGSTVSLSNLSLATTGTYTVYADPSGIATGQATIGVTRISGPMSASLAGGVASDGSQAATVSDPTRTEPVDDALDPRRVPPVADESETWTPDRYNLRGDDWTSHRSDGALATMPPLKAPPGETAISGQVLVVNGRPLANVTLSVDGHSTRSDRTGRFLLTGLTSGHHELTIDGRTANTPGREFGVFEAGVDVADGQTLVLPYTIWMTRLDTAHAVHIASPTTKDTVVTTPKIPGFEVRLPKGSVVKDASGKVVTELSITAVPVDRPPFPLPPGVVTPVYFTVQPGGSYVFPSGAQIVYPNTTGLAAGTRVEFWDYDPEVKGWYVYGHGTVTPDGRQVVPDPGVRVWEFSGAMINVAGLLKALFNLLNDFFHFDGDPVDLGTGLFEERHTDLTVPDVMPISVTRTYRQLDNAKRPFGVGTNFDYGIFLQSAHQYTEADLVFPDSSSVHFVRTSPGSSWTDAVFAAVDTTGPFRNATMAWNGDGWNLVRTDGMVYVFGENQPLQAIRDRHGNQVTVTHANGQAGNITQVTSPSGRWIKFSYDASNRITQARDDTGRVVGYVYDTAGRLVQVTSPGGAVTRYGYNANNAMTTITDARNITYLTNTFDAAGKVATQTLADGGTYQFAYVTDANGYSTQTTVTAPDGTRRRAAFDANHYETAETVALGTPLERTVSVVRDPTTRLVQSITDPHGRSVTATYDTAGNPTSVTEPGGRTTQFAYGAPYNQISSVTDWAGRTSSFGYNAAGDVTAVTDAAGRTSHVEYDPTGRPTKVVDPLGNQTTIGYEIGDPVSVTDALGRTTRRFFDAAGRLAAVTDATGATTTVRYDADNNVLSTVDPLGRTTSFGRDANGNRTSVTDARGHTTTFTYDASDRATDRTDPLGHAAHATYDTMGRPTTATDARGKTTVYQYDALGRLTFVGYGASAGPSYESTVSYTYDGFDRLASAVDSVSGTTTFGYDDLDQLTDVTTAAGRVRYTYDDLGRRQTMSVPGQSTITYGYDATDLVSSISQGSTSVTWQRDGAGRTSSVHQPGVTTTYRYDAASQLTGITSTTPSGDPIGDLAYTYDANGRIATLAGSLARVTIPSTGPPVTYDDADQLTSRGGTSFGYDAAGNLTSDGTNTYTWDARGQLSGVTGPGVSASYEYDTAGRRTGTTVNGAATTYLYDGPNIVREQSAGGTVDRLTAGADETLQRTAGGSTRSPVSDALGSTVGLVDPATSALSTQYAYEPYGAPTRSGAPDGNTQQFTGREYDAQTGLQNNRARYYSPELGRFISRDPAGFGGGSTNLYEYAYSDPVNIADPNGDCPFCAAMAAGCVIGGIVNVALGWGLSSMEGRKYSVGDGFRDFGEGCVAGALFEFGGWVFRLGRLAGEARLISQLTHGFLDRIAASSRVTATLVASLDGQLVRIVASGGRDLSPAQRAFVKAMGWIAAKAAGKHAEETVLAKAAELGAKPIVMVIYGGGKDLALPICEEICIPAVTKAGGRLFDPWTVIWWW